MLKKRKAVTLGQEAKPKPLHEQSLKSLSAAKPIQENAKKDKFKWAKKSFKTKYVAKDSKKRQHVQKWIQKAKREAKNLKSDKG